MKKILVVGQTPPPYGGQAIMIENMLKANFDKVKLYHVRMNFSSDMDEVGKFKLSKITKLIVLIIKIYYYRFRYQLSALYYPPAPPQRVPILRDIVLLNATRWLFKSTIFHFHAAGVSEMHNHFTGLLKTLYERAYFYPETCIRLSEYNPEDSKALNAKHEYIVPNGLTDVGAAYLDSSKISNKQKLLTLLYVGLLCETKGILILLDSARILVEKKHQFLLQFVGRFESDHFQHKVEQYVQHHGLEHYVRFLGVRTGEEKHLIFAQADVFCYPTFFEAETFGLVALEAMQFKLPVVATHWRGLPSLIQDEINGFLVPPQKADVFAEKIEVLINDSTLRKEMGAAGRKIYIDKFTESHHLALLERALAH